MNQMKKFVKATALSLALAFASTAAIAEENIAFINAGYLFQNHPDVKSAAKTFEAKFKAQSDKLAANKKMIDGKIAALQKDAPNLRRADIQKREDDIKKLMKDHDANVQKFQKEAEKAENNERTRILESIQTATNNIAKEKGYSYVLDANSVVFATEGKDITEDVLKALNNAPAATAPAKTESAEPAKQDAPAQPAPSKAEETKAN